MALAVLGRWWCLSPQGGAGKPRCLVRSSRKKKKNQKNLKPNPPVPSTTEIYHLCHLLLAQGEKYPE